MTRERCVQKLVFLAVALCACLSQVPAHARAKVSSLILDGSHWSLASSDGMMSINATATVPSSVPDELYKHGIIFDSDPRFGYNQNAVLDLMSTENFTYSTQFDGAELPSLPTLKNGSLVGRYELVLAGIDTFCVVLLNDMEVGRTNNMHIPFHFDVTHELKPHGTNTLSLQLTNAIDGARAVASSPAFADPECKKFPRTKWVDVFGHGTECSAYARQHTGSFGWDCSRAWVGQMVARSVSIRAIPSVAIDYVVPNISLATSGNEDFRDNDNNFSVSLDVFLSLPSASFQNGNLLQLNVTAEWLPQTVTFYENISNSQTRRTRFDQSIDAQGPTQIRVPLRDGLGAENVGLWWPAGHGQTRQLRYDVTVDVAIVGGPPTHDAYAKNDVEKQSDSATIRVGFRTFEFVGAVDDSSNHTWPLFFKFNRRPLFAKGFNFMPVDVLPLPDDPVQVARSNQLLQDAAAVGANTIRVWGGGLYQSDAFYEKADELGLLVLQDGSFFGTYPDVKEFNDLVRAEVTAVSRRIAWHPSLVLWSGNNESPVYGNEDLFVATQLATVKSENPNVFVYPSNPSNGWQTIDPLVPRPTTKNLSVPHDSHFYGPCGSIAQGAMFASEFGWPSAPLLDSYQHVIPAAEQFLGAGFHSWRSTIQNPLWLNESMPSPESTLAAVFPLLLNHTSASTNGSVIGSRDDLDRWLYLTQALQSHCLGLSIEAYRQQENVMGTLVWSLGEIWTAPAWSTIQHDGVWKMAHYRMRNVFEDVHVSFQQDSADRLVAFVDNHSPDPVSLNCTIEVHAWQRNFLTYGAHALLKKKVKLPSLESVVWLNTTFDALVGIEDLGFNCSPSSCFFKAACSGVSTPLNPCAGHRCDGGASCPCGCECGTPSDPGLCFVPQQSEANDTDALEISTQEFFTPVPLPMTQMVMQPTVRMHVTCPPASRQFVVNISSNETVPLVYISSPIAGTFSDNGFWLVDNSLQAASRQALTTSVTFQPRSGSNATCAEFTQSLKLYAPSLSRAQYPWDRHANTKTTLST